MEPALGEDESVFGESPAARAVPDVQVHRAVERLVWRLGRYGNGSTMRGTCPIDDCPEPASDTGVCIGHEGTPLAEEIP
jgi:hypothetical protein